MEYASVWQRFGAFWIDLIILFVVFWALILPLLFTDINPALGGATFVLLFLFEDVLYFIMMEAKYSKTLGKMLFKIRVVAEDNKKINFKQSLMRNIFKAPLLRVVLIADFFMIIKTEKHQRIGDMIAKTIVIKG